MTGWVNGWDVMISIHGSESIWLGRPVGYPWVVVMVVVGGFKQVGGWVDGWVDGPVCVCVGSWYVGPGLKPSRLSSLRIESRNGLIDGATRPRPSIAARGEQSTKLRMQIENRS